MRRIFFQRQAIVLVVFVATLATGAGAQTSPVPRSLTTVTPDDLLAVLDWKVLQAQLSDGSQWWPAFPQFNVGIGDEAQGLRFYVVQQFRLVSTRGALTSRLDTTLLSYEDAAAAAKDFNGRLLTVNDKGTQPTGVPQIGDQARYFVRDSGRPDSFRYEYTIRLVAGPFVSRISFFKATRQDPVTLESMARYARTIAIRIRQLLSGNLNAQAIPARLEALMPPKSTASVVGQVFGSTVMPPETWALADVAGRPVHVLDALKRGGLDELGFRRYGLAANPDHVVEATLFVFATPEHAAAWQREFMRSIPRQGALNPGQTGAISGFTVWPNSGAYELMFAKGQVVGDVLCEAPFAKTSSVCERAVRVLAEGWYAALPVPR